MFFLFFLFFGWQDSLVQKMDRFLQTQKVRPFNGVLLIADHKGIIYQKASGLALGQEKMDIERKFAIASVSKQFTAALILRLVDEEKIRLEDPLSVFFPELRWSWRNKVTVHHLLNHTSGLRGLNQALGFEPGTRFEYSNLNYILLGRILALKHQKTYNEVALELFDQLKLRNSSVIPHVQLQKVLEEIPHFTEGFYEDTQSQMKRREIFEKISFNPTGGLISTVQDLWKWNQRLHEGKVLKPETYQKMMTPYLQRKYRFGNLGYGYGIHISESDGIIEYFHAGFLKGYISSLYYYPQYKLTLVVLENRSWWQGKPHRVYHIHDFTRNTLRYFLQRNKPEVLTSFNKILDNKNKNSTLEIDSLP